MLRRLFPRSSTVDNAISNVRRQLSLQSNSVPEAVKIVEVGPRDGLQVIAFFLPQHAVHSLNASLSF